MDILESKYGNDGYAFWFKLLEILGDSQDHFFDTTKEENMMWLSSRVNISEEKCRDILDTLTRLDSIDRELWKEHGVIWSKNFVDNISRVYKKRESKTPPRPSFGDENKGNNRVFDTEKGVSDTKTPQSIVKESKGKESTEKENKYIDEIREIFAHWIDEEAGTKHRSLKQPMKKAIRARLKEGHTVDEIKQAITNLSTALHSDKFFWTHRWTLKDFLSREQGGKMETFRDGIEHLKKNDEEKEKSEYEQLEEQYGI